MIGREVTRQAISWHKLQVARILELYLDPFHESLVSFVLAMTTCITVGMSYHLRTGVEGYGNGNIYISSVTLGYFCRFNA